MGQERGKARHVMTSQSSESSQYRGAFAREDQLEPILTRIIAVTAEVRMNHEFSDLAHDRKSVTIRIPK